MAVAPKVQGPASYFPSIEKKYGQPMAHWFALAESRSGAKHMEIVNWLKAEHCMGHGAWGMGMRMPSWGIAWRKSAER